MEALNPDSVRTLHSLFGDDKDTIGEIFGGLFHSHISKGVKAEVHLTVFIVDKYVHEVYQLQPARASSSTISLGPAPVAVIDVRGNEATFWVQDGGGLRSGVVWEVQHLLRYSERLVAKACPPLSPTPDGHPRRQGMTTELEEETEATAYLTADRLQQSLRPRPDRPQSHEGSPAAYQSFTEDHGDEAGPSTSRDDPYLVADRHRKLERTCATGLDASQSSMPGYAVVTAPRLPAFAPPVPPADLDDSAPSVILPQPKEKKGWAKRIKGFVKSCVTTKKDGQLNVERARSELSDDEDIFPDVPRPRLASPLRRKRRSSDDGDDDEDEPANEPKRPRLRRESDASGQAPAQAPAPGQAPAVAPAPGPALAPATPPALIVPNNATAPDAVVVQDLELPDKEDIKRTVQELPDTSFATHHKDIKEICEALIFSKKMSLVTTTSARKKTMESLKKTFYLLVHHPMTREEYNQLAFELNQLISRLAHLVQLGEKFNRYLKRRMERAAGGRRKVTFTQGMEARFDAFKAYNDRLRRDMEGLNGELNGY